MVPERTRPAENVRERREPFDGGIDWKAGGLAGLVATVIMGVAMTVTDVAVLQDAIAGLYGFERNLVMGWVAHLFHGTLFGGVFAAMLSDPVLYRVDRSVLKTVVAGVVYGVVLAVFGAGLIMPVWLALVGVETTLSVPAVTVPTVAWHVLYGLVLGVGYYVAENQSDVDVL